jgi:hypothetical protein
MKSIIYLQKGFGCVVAYITFPICYWRFVANVFMIEVGPFGYGFQDSIRSGHEAFARVTVKP